MQVNFLGFEVLKELCWYDNSFWQIWRENSNKSYNSSSFKMVIFSRKSALVLLNALWGTLSSLKRSRTASLEDISAKTQLQQLIQKKSWPKIEQDIMKYVARCRACHTVKRHGNTIRFYTLLPTCKAPWQDIILDFVIGLPKLRGTKTCLSGGWSFFKDGALCFLWRDFWRSKCG